MYPHRPASQEQTSPGYYPPLPGASPTNTQSQPPTPGQPNGAAYPPATVPPTQQQPLPPISDYARPDMALHAAPPQQPPAAYPPGYPPPPPGYPPYRASHDPYRPPAQGYHPYPPPHQPAPRQRTAIACRYCRRRKIRCSGFDQSEDGRCANCQRFSQECIFTPVSAQTQAFVPAHAVYGRGHLPQSQQLFGAYGQPLPPAQPGQPDPYAASRPPAYPHPGQPGPYPPQQAAPGHYPPPPHSAGAPPAHYPPPGPPGPDPNGLNGTHKRPNGEPHTPTLPPPNPATSAPADYRYADPTAMGAAPVSPASNASHQSGAQPYYQAPPAQIPRRSPPQATSPYAQDGRSSASPHTHHQPTYPPYPGEPNLKPPTGHADGRTPPPQSTTPTQGGQNAAGGARPGLSISSIVSGDQVSRRQEDRDMLKRLG